MMGDVQNQPMWGLNWGQTILVAVLDQHVPDIGLTNRNANSVRPDPLVFTCSHMFLVALKMTFWPLKKIKFTWMSVHVSWDGVVHLAVYAGLSVLKHIIVVLSPVSFMMDYNYCQQQTDKNLAKCSYYALVATPANFNSHSSKPQLLQRVADALMMDEWVQTQSLTWALFPRWLHKHLKEGLYTTLLGEHVLR